MVLRIIIHRILRKFPIHLSIAEKSSQSKILIQSGAERYPRNKKGATPLDLADKKNHLEVATFLRSLRKKHYKQVDL